MISREELKKEVDKLPENLLDEVYAFLKRVILQKKTSRQITIRNFHGELDNKDIRKAAYE
jgi:hypothetical protein